MKNKTVRAKLRNGSTAQIWLCEPVAIFFEIMGVVVGDNERFPYNAQLWSQKGRWSEDGEDHPLDIVTDIPFNFE